MTLAEAYAAQIASGATPAQAAGRTGYVPGDQPPPHVPNASPARSDNCIRGEAKDFKAAQAELNAKAESNRPTSMITDNPSLRLSDLAKQGAASSKATNARTAGWTPSSEDLAEMTQKMKDKIDVPKTLSQFRAFTMVGQRKVYGSALDFKRKGLAYVVERVGTEIEVGR